MTTEGREITDETRHAIAAELDAVFGRAVNDVVFSALVNEVAEARAGADESAYVLVPALGRGGVYTAVFMDGSSAVWTPRAQAA